ncbi:hypothetical protein BGZ97_002835 [Linnemannia gamsii]|uniref:Uncharacterized protein n=1 Tax=Linnemannia gamsii TaxID=64522 RepID=A0A9P6QU20_9FUNG|nr:hypothetical protein BGZ97_002835 [Linnemannia gamsii]
MSSNSDGWKCHIPPKRRGASYFLSNPPRAWTATAYFDARNLSFLNKASLVGELGEWINHFRSSDCQVLIDMATNLERTNTHAYWVDKEVSNYEQAMASTMRKRSLAIRKENLKQHHIDSAAMTLELEVLHPAQDVDEPLNPFVTRRSDTGSLNSTANSSSCTVDSDPGEAMDQSDQASTTPLSLASSGSYKPSESCSPETSPWKKREWRYIYPLGQGRLHYPATFHRSLMMDDYDVAAVLWALRENIVEKVPVPVNVEDGKQIAELERPHEFLVLNHIYLVQRDDCSSSVYACVGRKLWRSLQAPAHSMMISDEVATGLVRLALQVSAMDYQAGRLLLRGWVGEEAVQDLLKSLVDTNTLWDLDMDGDNELGLTRKRLDPFLSAFITHLPDSTHHWDYALEPSTKRRGVDRDTGGVRPDFQSYFRSGNNKFHLLMIEIKKKQQAGSSVLSDLEKLALQLKDCLDGLAQDCINVNGVRIYGIVIVGHEIDLYAMSLEAPGMYIMRQISKAYLPRNHFDLGMLPQIVNLFMGLQLGLQESYALCTRPRVNHANTDVCPTLGTPIKVPIAKARALVSFLTSV